MAPNSPECSFIHASMAGSRSTAPSNRSNSVLIISLPSAFESCVYVTEGLPVTRDKDNQEFSVLVDPIVEPWKADQIGYAAQRATPVSRTPDSTKGGRAARSIALACHSAAAPIANISGARNLAASTEARRDSRLIHPGMVPPANAKQMANRGIRTSISDDASRIFLTRKSARSIMPLAANASRNCQSTRATKSRLKEMAKQSVMSVAPMAQQTPQITASTSDPVRSHAAAPAVPNNASVSNTGLITRTNGLVGTNDSIK